MPPKLRWLLLTIGLGLTLVAVGKVGSGENENIAEDRAQNHGASLMLAARGAPEVEWPALDLHRLERRIEKTEVRDVFKSKNWAPPAPPPRPAQAKSQATVAPVAPPQPFSYIGKLIDAGQVVVFLARGDRNYMVHLHDVIDSSYRVDEISDQAVALTYLPLNVRQTLPTGAPN